MTKTEKRIEVIKLLQRLRKDDELPGDIILRALRALSAVTSHERNTNDL